MFKENSAEKLIEYIQTLPVKEQKLIAEGISHTKQAKKDKGAKGRKKSGIKEMGSFLDSLGHKLPKNYKFNREEANER